MILDINSGEPLKITEVKWVPVGSQDYNLVPATGRGVTIKDVFAKRLLNGCYLCSNKEEVEDLIKALQKAIDLGWVK